MQALSVDQFVGQVLGNHRVVRLLGQGRLSAIYLGQNIHSATNVAISLFLLPERFSPDARSRFIQRFRKEAVALAALQHPHILPVHEYGEYLGYPYLITPYMTNGSLSDVIKREGRCHHTTALEILEQVVEGLEFAHSKGVIHGTLKPANILLSSDEKMLVAGFGLMHILQRRGIEQDDRPYGHLMSIVDTFLPAPEYLAPEIVQGQVIDVRSDVYALGIILFELLAGKPPFSGSNPLEVAKLHVQQQIPPLRSLCPDLPIALESVVNQALERDLSRRFRTAGELVEAFAQVSKGVANQKTTRSQSERAGTVAVPDLPATGFQSGGNWQLVPPIVTGQFAALPTSPQDSGRLPATKAAPQSTDSWLLSSAPITDGLPPVQKVSNRTAQEPVVPVRENTPLVRAVPPPVVPDPKPTLIPMNDEKTIAVSRPADPQPQQKPTDQQQAYEAWTQVAPPPPPLPDPLRLSSPEINWKPDQYTIRSAPVKRSSPKNRAGRRTVLALLAGGGLVAATVGITTAINLSRMGGNGNTAMVPPGNGNTGTGTNTNMPPGNQQQTQNNPPANNNQQPVNGGTTPGKGNGNQGAMQNNPPANQKNQPPNAPGAQVGKSIGSTNLGISSAMDFTNPNTKRMDVLIHLPNGTFAAYDKACTHQGVLVRYDPGTNTLVCPLHGSVFDATNGEVIQGPADKALPTVAIRVLNNGMITLA